MLNFNRQVGATNPWNWKKPVQSGALRRKFILIKLIVDAQVEVVGVVRRLTVLAAEYSMSIASIRQTEHSHYALYFICHFQRGNHVGYFQHKENTGRPSDAICYKGRKGLQRLRCGWTRMEPCPCKPLGFDPTGLERAAKAAREIDASTNACVCVHCCVFVRIILAAAQAALAFDVILQHETTKQLEHETRQAAYEMQSRKYEIERIKDEGDEARQTLAVTTV